MQVLDQPSAVTESNVESRLSSSIDNSDEISSPHIGKWNKLVSQTNWEKGTCILNWRSELAAAGLPGTAYSDDSWSKRVGISPQHTGRLRRVAERFADKQSSYTGLYWSHFNAAFDWDDAELWLEGAVQNGWSVTQMKVQRAETVGASDDMKPREEDIFTGEIEEDSYFSPESVHRQTPQTIEERTAVIGAADITEGFDAGSGQSAEPSDTPSNRKAAKPNKKTPLAAGALENITTAVALAKLQCLHLPEDFTEALEKLMLSVLNHKAAGWKKVSQQELADLFDLLKTLVYAVEG
ncbi:MAG: hypothetical protein LBT46_07735 [Planctomycetaceae bacterium]|nr:hypothetical protein [Planctomycetaceae bacterium]